jgi:cytochrome b
MDRTRVYDLPTRVFHWLFAGIFVTAFFIAKTFDDDSAYFSFHMLLGFVLAAIVALRVIWGVVGSRYARFSSFALNPLDLIRYFRELFGAKPARSLGHNPASSWAALLMMGLAVGLAITGYLMTSGNKETFEDVHELLANAFAVTAIVHVAGVSFHTLRHRDAIALAMVIGKKKAVDDQPGIERSYRGVAVLFLLLVGAFALNLGRNYDFGARTLSWFGTTLQLGESGDED